MPAPLSEVFQGSLAPSLRASLGARPSLERELEDLVQRARGAHPDLEVDGIGFVAFVAGLATADTDFGALHAGDLLLAFACLLGDPTALALFERDVIGRSAVVMRGNLPPGLTADEVLQRLRVRLLLREGERAPGLSTYSGRGPLLHWSRASAARLVQEYARSTRREVATEAELLEAPGLARDVEVSLLKKQFSEVFSAAFKRALETLSPRDQHLLRLHYLEGLRAEELGRVFDTHRATVWRWLTACRESLLQATRAELAKSVKDSELSSLMNAVHSQLDVSLSRVLREDGKG